jgi:hypothetical protein
VESLAEDESDAVALLDESLVLAEALDVCELCDAVHGKRISLRLPENINQAAKPSSTATTRTTM